VKPSDIKVGESYINKGAGTTIRTVVAIENETPGENSPVWWSTKERPSEKVVTFTTTNRQWKKDKQYHLFIRSFAQWAGKVAPK